MLFRSITSGTLAAARVPLATTTTAGGVIVPTSGGLSVDGSGNISAPLATLTQAQSGSSAAAFMSSSRVVDAITNHRMIYLASMPGNTSGIATVSTSNPPATYNTSVGSASGGGSFLVFPASSGLWSASLPTWNGSTGNFNGRYLNWARRFRFRIRFSLNVLPTTNATFRFLVGKTSTGTAAIGQFASSARGIGFEIRNTQLWLTTANGTARTDTQATGVTLTGGGAYEVICDSDGSGNATLLLDQTVVASSTGAPTTARTDFSAEIVSIEGTTTDSAQSQIFWDAFPIFMLS